VVSFELPGSLPDRPHIITAARLRFAADPEPASALGEFLPMRLGADAGLLGF
jgi:hypothetical protein